MTLAAPRLNRLPAGERGITIGDFLVPIAIGERISERARHAALIVIGAVLIALTANIAIVLHGQTFTLPGDVRVTLPGLARADHGPDVRRAPRRRRAGLPPRAHVGGPVPRPGAGAPGLCRGASGLHTIIGRDAGHWALGATGGYLLGFVLAAAIVGRLAELGWDRHVGGAVVAMLLGNVVIYLVGVPWLMVAAGFDLTTGLAKGVYPFLVGDVVKLAFAGIIFPAAWWLVGRGDGAR